MKYQMEIRLEIRQLDDDGRPIYHTGSFQLQDIVPLGEQTLAGMLPIMSDLHETLKRYGVSKR